MGLSHAQQTDKTISHDSNSYFQLQQPAAAQAPHRSTMASGSFSKPFLDHDTKIWLFKQYRQFWASGPAAAFAVLAGSPFENVKTRMQSYHFSSAWSAAKFVYHKEGIRGFWAGTLAPLVSITGNRVLGFIAYRRAKYEVDRLIESTTGDSPLQWVNTPGTYPTLSTLACFTTAGVIQGALLTPVLTPIELLKNASQTAVLMSPENSSAKASDKSQPRSKSAAPRVSTISAASQIIRNRGFMTLFTGFRLHLIRDMIGGGVYFGVYESCKQALGSFYGDDMKNTPWAIPLAGAICGISSWVVTYPIDTMKTRAQNQLLGVPQPKEALTAAAAAMAKSSKWKGIEMVIVRTAIQNMIQMTAFEQVKVWIDNAKFKDGSTNLPTIQREKGRDRKILKVISEGSDSKK